MQRLLEHLAFKPQTVNRNDVVTPEPYDTVAVTSMKDPHGMDDDIYLDVPIFILGGGEPSMKHILLLSYGNSDHANADGILQLAMIARRDTGMTVVTYDYPGYGIFANRPDIAPSQARMYASGEAVLKWLRKEYPRHTIHLYGHSLGTTVTAHLMCFQRDVGCTVLVAPLCSALWALPWYLRFARELLHWADAFCALEEIKQCHQAGETRWKHILLLHGSDDTVISADNVEAFMDEFGDAATRIEAIGVGHNFTTDDLRTLGVFQWITHCARE